MTKRKKGNKLVVNWITREDILSSYFVPEEREKVLNKGIKLGCQKGRQEGRKEALKEAEEKIHQALISNILSFYRNGVSKDLILKSFNISEKEFNDIVAQDQNVSMAR